MPRENKVVTIIYLVGFIAIIFMSCLLSHELLTNKGNRIYFRNFLFSQNKYLRLRNNCANNSNYTNNY